MKVNVRKIIILVLWAGLFIFLYRKGFVTTDADKVRNFLESNPARMTEIFIFISIARVVLFLPGIVFMLLGGVYFGPLTGSILSLVSMILSETIVYLCGRYFAGQKIRGYLEKRYTDLMLLADRHGYEFLALGILCPVAPSDMVCLVASILNFEYKKYIFTIAMANIPMLLLYSYLGSNGLDMTGQKAILLAVLAVILIYTGYIWIKTKRRISKNKNL